METTADRIETLKGQKVMVRTGMSFTSAIPLSSEDAKPLDDLMTVATQIVPVETGLKASMVIMNHATIQAVERAKSVRLRSVIYGHSESEEDAADVWFLAHQLQMPVVMSEKEQDGHARIISEIQHGFAFEFPINLGSLPLTPASDAPRPLT